MFWLRNKKLFSCYALLTKVLCFQPNKAQTSLLKDLLEYWHFVYSKISYYASWRANYKGSDQTACNKVRFSHSKAHIGGVIRKFAENSCHFYIVWSIELELQHTILQHICSWSVTTCLMLVVYVLYSCCQGNAI